MDQLIFLERALEPIDRILNAFLVIMNNILGNGGYLLGIVNTITGNAYLLISVSLVLIGFVIGIISHLIRN